jgi:hypothetical protein
MSNKTAETGVQGLFPYADLSGENPGEIKCLSVRGRSDLCLRRDQVGSEDGRMVVVRRGAGCKGCSWSGAGMAN